jgi:hypothetical protein
MNAPGRGFACRLHPAMAAVAAWVVCAWTAGAAAQSVWELTAYRVQLIVALEPVAELAHDVQADLERGLIDRVESVVGAAWDVTASSPTPRLRHRVLSDIDRLAPEDLPETSRKFDKVMLVAVGAGPGGYTIRVREYDVRTGAFGSLVRRTVWQPAKLRDAALRAMLDAFAPLALVIGSEKKTVTLRLRAAGLPIRDPSIVQVRTGDVFQPMIRYNDRDGNLRKVIPIPWTVFIVEQFTPKLFQCQIHSALVSPLSGRRRGRVEQLALAVRPEGNTTRLVLTTQTEPKHVLTGYNVYVHPPDSTATTLLGRTDAEGGILVPAAKHPVRVLLVKNGDALLARLPIVPGLAPELVAEIPSDDQRLAVEEYVTGVQEELVDVYVRREVLLARAAKYIEDAELDKAAKVVEELQGLQTRTEMLRQLDLQQRDLSPDNPRVGKKIDALFADTRMLMEKFLDPEPIEKIGRDLVSARSKPPAEKAPTAKEASPQKPAAKEPAAEKVPAVPPPPPAEKQTDAGEART